MTPTLGGPGVACSELRVRRLVAGELAGEARERTRAHVEGCARCAATRERLAAEQAELDRSLPFPAFAAGVAERLARTAAPPPVRARRPRAAIGLALAASVAAAVALPFAVERRSTGMDTRPKGGAELTVHVADGARSRPLAPDEPVPPGARLRLAISSPPGTFVAVALLDADGTAVLHAGPATQGPLPGAFEWTGDGDGVLVAVVDAAPVDVAALARRLEARGAAGASPGGRAEVVIRPLRRHR